MKVSRYNDKNIKIGRRIKERRKMLKMTQVEFASLTGETVNAVYMIEQGKRDLTVSKLYLIAEVLRVNLPFLLGIDAPPMMDGQPRSICINDKGLELCDIVNIRRNLVRYYKMSKKTEERLNGELAEECRNRGKRKVC